MKKQKLTYRIHNHNTEDSTLTHLLVVLLESNARKVDSIIKQSSKSQNNSLEVVICFHTGYLRKIHIDIEQQIIIGK